MSPCLQSLPDGLRQVQLHHPPGPGVSPMNSQCPVTPPLGFHGSFSLWGPGPEWGAHAPLCKPTLFLIRSHRATGARSWSTP